MRKKTNEKPERIISSLNYLSSLIDIKEIVDEEYSIIRVKNGGKEDSLMAFLQISGIDIFGFTDEDKFITYNNFANATMAMKQPHKYVFTDTYPTLSEQKKYIEYKLSKDISPFYKEILSREEGYMKAIEHNQKDRVAYMEIFGKTDDLSEMKNSIENYISIMSKDTVVRICTPDEIKGFLQKILSLKDSSDTNVELSDFNRACLPDKISFHSNYFVLNDTTYGTIIEVYEYPSYIDDLLLANLVNKYSDTLCTLDIISNHTRNIVEDVKHSLDEINTRGEIKQNVSQQIDNQAEMQDLVDLYNDLSRGKEKVVTTTLRFYVTSDSFEGLNRKVNDLKTDLSNIGITIIIDSNDLINDYRNLLRSADNMGNPFPLHDTFKCQYPFFFQSHIDNHSYYFGQTATGGIVLFNNFVKNSNIGRDSYDTLLVGKKGAGKSATLKSMIQSVLMYGHKVLVLDVENEYKQMADVLDGTVINMNRQSVINALQIYKAFDSSAEDDLDENESIFETNYAREISRIRTFLSQYSPSITSEQLDDFIEILEKVYAVKGITAQTDISELGSKDFPVFNDVYNEITRQISNVTGSKKDSLEALQRILRPISVGSYSSMFNGYTTVDISTNNFIIFNVKQIADMEENIFNAQLFNILSLMWTEVAKNTEYNRTRGELDRRFVVPVIDEAHRFISTKNIQVTDFIEKLVRRARKYFAALWFATQSIKDFYPSAASENADKITVIFSLLQYKMIMKQSDDCIEMLRDIFPQFSSSELNNVPLFRSGDMLLSISSGRQKVTCRKYIADSDFLYMGTKEDTLRILKSIFKQNYLEERTKEDVIKLLKETDTRYFCDYFTREVMEHFGYSDDCSETLYSIIFEGVEVMVRDILRGAF